VTDTERKAIRARNKALTGLVRVRPEPRVSGGPRDLRARREPIFIHPSQYRRRRDDVQD
jgi:hypothetical protein